MRLRCETVRVDAPRLLEALRARVPEMVDDLADLVAAESPSNDAALLRTCARTVARLGQPHLGEAELVEVGDRVHVRWRRGTPRVLLLGHFDTVWRRGTTQRWGFGIRGDRATGPGVFDMKAGIVQALYALGTLEDLEGVEVLLTADEEVGSATSRKVIEDAARSTDAVLVLEPSAAGDLKIARKGIVVYEVITTGRAAHAGLDPDEGVNALLEAAHQALAIAELARDDVGTTVTPSMLSAGTTTNTVPARATLHVDVRTATFEEQERVDAEMRAVRPKLFGATVTVAADMRRPPLPRAASGALFERAQRLAAELGIGPIAGAEVGGGSDGNLTAALGVPTLDGLGAVGGNAHAEGEWVEVDRMPERAALVAALVDELRR